MDELCDLKEICDIKPFDEVYISTDDEEPVPKISGVCSIANEAVPKASKEKYCRVYNEFINWQKKRNVNAISDPLVTEYFKELSIKQKPTSLWSYYSMLKRMFQVKLNINISSYNEVLCFLKTFSSGYEPVKSKSFTEKEVAKFIFEAPDFAWLDIKTVCIFGVCGSLKNNELRSVKANDVEQHGDLLLVRIEDSNTKAVRSFTITGKFCTIVKKYMALRPPHSPLDRFFVNYQRGKCTIQPIGKNKLGHMPQKIAQYLSLPEPDRYTGQAFRISGQLILKNTTQTIDGRIMDTIERTYSSSSNTTQSVGMIETSSHDSDCKSEYEETMDMEGRFCAENLLKVDYLRLHCTTCDTHIGCAVANEGNVRSHPVLFVTQCKNCHTYYNKRDFTKGEDGSELQCRWCAQGGEVYSCSKCPYVFCRKCILQNLSRNVITEIEGSDKWQCFSCLPNVISHLRAQHWALTNHIRQTKTQIRGMKDSNQLYELMYKDLTLCCKGKEPLNSRQNSKDRRHLYSGNNSDCSTPEPKRMRNNSGVCMPIPPAEESRTSGTIQLSHRTPTILSQKSVTPPPLVMLGQLPSPSEPAQLTLRPIHSLLSERPTSPQKVIDIQSNSSSFQNAFPNIQLPTVPNVTSPGYQTYNILVDLAAEEDTYVRLPNGKLIQFRPQTEQTHQTVESTQHVTSAQIIHQPSLQILNVNQPLQQQEHSLQQRHPLKPQQRQPLQPQQSMQQHQRPDIQQSNPRAAAKPQRPRPMLKQFPNSPLGKAQAELEKDIHGTQDICEQIVKKCNALMKSNAYNSVQSSNDVRDLHQHLSYLFTYAIDRFTTLKSKSMDAMRSLTNAHVATKKLLQIEADDMIDVEDDVQVIEPVTECIQIDSDDETEPEKISAPVGVVENTQSDKPQIENNNQNTSRQVKSIVQAPTVILDHADNDDFELPIPPPIDTDNASYDRENDEKLKATPIVVLEKNEKIERKLQEILQRQQSENDFSSPVNDESLLLINNLMDAHAILESGTSSAHKLLKNGIVGNDHEYNVEMRSDGGEKNDPFSKDQAKVGKPTQFTKSDECNKVDLNVEHEEIEASIKFYKPNVRDKHEIHIGFDNLMNAQNEDKEVGDSGSNFNLSYLQSSDGSQIIGNADIDLLNNMDHQNNLSKNVSSADAFCDMPRNKSADHFVILATAKDVPDLQ